MTEQECIEKYGAIQDGIWRNEAKWCSMVTLPTEVQAQVKNVFTGGLWVHVFCNNDLKFALLAALHSLIEKGFLHELETFNGCYEIRDIRGRPGEYSAHSWAMAIDFNANKNPLGGESSWSDGFVQCFKDAGFAWGGDFHGRKDPMHFSMTGF